MTRGEWTRFFQLMVFPIFMRRNRSVNNMMDYTVIRSLCTVSRAMFFPGECRPRNTRSTRLDLSGHFLRKRIARSFNRASAVSVILWHLLFSNRLTDIYSAIYSVGHGKVDVRLNLGNKRLKTLLICELLLLNYGLIPVSIEKCCTSLRCVHSARQVSVFMSRTKTYRRVL